MHVVQLSNTIEIPELFKFCMDRVVEMYGNDYELVIKPVIKAKSDSRKYKDEILIKNPYAMYLDWDVIPIKPIDFNLELGYVYVYRKIFDEGCAGGVIIGNGCLETIEFMIEKRKEINKRNNCCHCTIVNRNQSKFRFIPNGYFLHLGLGAMIKYNNLKNGMCEIEKSLDGNYRFKWIKNVLE